MKLLNMIETLSMRVRRVLAAGALLFALAVITVATVTWAKHRSTTVSVASAVRTNASTVSKTETAVPQQPRRAIADFESELITVTPHGFEPREISRPRGRFLLMIDNRSGLAEFSPRLSREAGPTLTNINLPREEPDWSELLNLPPGRYLLTEANHPRWSCLITITAQ
jgi:hypothetical protein